MRKLVMVVFPDEASANRGLHALRELHRAGSVFVFSAAVVVRSERGELAVRRRGDGLPAEARLERRILGDELLDGVGQGVAPGRFALVAEIWDERITPIDASMEPLGGKTVCEWWREYGESLVAADARRSAELETGSSGWNGAGRRDGLPS